MRKIKVFPIGLLAVALVAAAGMAACGSSEGAEPKQKAALLGMVSTPPVSVANLQLLDVSGPKPVPVAMKAPAGQLLLVYFGYTSCPDICPTTMSDLSVALNDLPPEMAKRVNVGMVTVDPDRDQPKVLAEYLEHFFDDPLPLQAADEATLSKVAKVFGVQYEVAEHKPGDSGYEVGHSAITYVVDDTGTVVVQWPFGFETQNMTKDLRTILGA